MAKTVYDRHRILNHIDSPLKIIFWTMNDFKIIISPVVISFLLFNDTLGGLPAGICSYVAIKFLKQRFGVTQLYPVLYWHLPANNRTRGLPASFKRRFNH